MLNTYKTPYIHIRGQGAWHDDIIIVANHSALLELRKAINKAIKVWVWQAENVFCNDWEWYNILVRNDYTDLEWLKLPYINLPCWL